MLTSFACPKSAFSNQAKIIFYENHHIEIYCVITFRSIWTRVQWIYISQCISRYMKPSVVDVNFARKLN